MSNIKQKSFSIKEKNVKSIISDTAESTNNRKVVFSFSDFGEKSHGFDCDAEEFKSLIKHLKTLSKMTWQEVQNSGRHQLGSEQIKKDQIKEPVPTLNDFALSFRYEAKKCFIGERENQILKIFYIDPSFNIYKHD